MSIKQETPRTGDGPAVRSKVLTGYCLEVPGPIPGSPWIDSFPGLDSRLLAAGTVRTQDSVVQVTQFVVFVLGSVRTLTPKSEKVHGTEEPCEETLN